MQGCTDLYCNFFGQNVGFEKKIDVKNQQKGEILRNFLLQVSDGPIIADNRKSVAKCLPMSMID